MLVPNALFDWSLDGWSLIIALNIGIHSVGVDAHASVQVVGLYAVNKAFGLDFFIAAELCASDLYSVDVEIEVSVLHASSAFANHIDFLTELVHVMPFSVVHVVTIAVAGLVLV